VIILPNPKGKKTISILVPSEYNFSGKDVKKELNSFFQYIWDNNEDIVNNYTKVDIIKEMLGKW
jgi:hypothetical protein